MKQMMTVFRFTYRDAVRKKAFIITTVLVALVIVLGCAAINIFGSSDDDAEAAPQAQELKLTRVLFMDEANAIPGAEEALKEYGFLPQRVTEENRQAALDEVAEDDGLAFIEIWSGEKPEICLHVKSFMADVNASVLREALSAAWMADQLAPSGLTRAEIQFATQPLALHQQAESEMNPLSYTLGLLVTMIMFFAVYFYGLMVANSVATEKTSRVMETLVISAHPRSILLGKCLGSGAAGLTQLMILLVTAGLSVKVFLPEGIAIGGMALSLSALSLSNALLLIVYFLLGFALYALMNAVCGASVSRIEDISSAEMPLALIAMVSFYLGYFTAVMGMSSPVMEALAIYLPFAAPFGVPMRLLNGEVTMTQLGISVGILAVTIAAVAALSVRLYERSVMFYGKRLKLSDMLKLKK